MTIRVAAGAADTICDYAEGFVLHVTGADDLDAAVGAVTKVRNDIAALDRTSAGTATLAISNAVLAPGGPLLRVAQLDASESALRGIPGLLARRLEEAGVTQATVEAPEPGGLLDDLDICPNAVVLRLFPRPAGAAGSLPASWIDIACEWVLGDLAPTDAVPLRLLGVEFDVAVADAPAIVHQASLAGAWCDVVNGDLGERVRTASITFGRAPHVALAAGGPACDSTALLARFELLCDVGRDLAADLTYACVDVEATFEGIGLGLGAGGWRARGGASPNLVAGELCDVLVPDVFPFQILSKGHLTRLGADGPEPAIGVALEEGRVEVRVGATAGWLPINDARDDLLDEGIDLLSPLLATDEQVDELLSARPSRQVADETVSERAVVPAGTPDLEDIVLETMPHARRGLRLTFLELVSWLAHEPHSDAPATVSPVLATYARWFASALDDDRRQELKERARRVIGTGAAGAMAGLSADGRPGISPADEERVWTTTDWLIRVQAAAWLRLAGLVDSAGRLEEIGPTTNHLDLLRAVDVLGSAITIASRRIELTASIAGSERPDDAELVEQAAWEAWEAASETGGWVAASEAAAVGIPADLAYTTDLRVIECARDSRVREELETARRSIGDTAWTAALHAVADQAWTAGWAAAHRAIDAASVVPLQTAIDRGTRAATARTDLDDDARDEALEAAETAAKERLTRAALGSRAWQAHQHPWDDAWTAATEVDPGGLWSSVQDLARAAVDEGPWATGMAAARDAVSEVLHDAPRLVARAVGAAMAREAAGTSARGVAMRAAAVARAQGGDATAALDAAVEALAPTAAELQDAALALLDVLIGIRA